MEILTKVVPLHNQYVKNQILFSLPTNLGCSDSNFGANPKLANNVTFLLALYTVARCKGTDFVKEPIILG